MKPETYVVFNRTKDTCLAHDAEAAYSVFKRMKGLIGRSERTFGPGHALWIIPSDGVHTIGMRIPIDAAYLDSEGRVIKIYHKLAPFRVAALVLKARSVLELPAGTLAQTNTGIGDILEFKLKHENQ